MIFEPEVSEADTQSATGMHKDRPELEGTDAPNTELKQAAECDEEDAQSGDVETQPAMESVEDQNGSDMEPLEPQDEFYPSGERKRVRSACVACHERKLRCVMLKKGICRHCSEKQRTCTPRIEKKRGRPRNSELRSRPHFYATPNMNQLAQMGIHHGCDASAMGTMSGLGMQAAQLQHPGGHMIAMPAMTANGVMSGAGQTPTFISHQGSGAFNQQGMTPHILPNGQVSKRLPPLIFVLWTKLRLIALLADHHGRPSRDG